VKAFTVEVSTDGGNTWTKSANGVTTTTIGYKRIIPLNGSTSTYGDGYDINALRIHLTDGKACPLLHTIAIY
jgi:alpha-L-fucosidase